MGSGPRADDAAAPVERRAAVTVLMEEESDWPWYGQLMKTPQTVAYLLQVNFWLEHYQVELTGF